MVPKQSPSVADDGNDHDHDHIHDICNANTQLLSGLATSCDRRIELKKFRPKVVGGTWELAPVGVVLRAAWKTERGI